jgi:hypothetical protein
MLVEAIDVDGGECGAARGKGGGDGRAGLPWCCDSDEVEDEIEMSGRRVMTYLTGAITRQDKPRKKPKLRLIALANSLNFERRK